MNSNFRLLLKGLNINLQYSSAPIQTGETTITTTTMTTSAGGSVLGNSDESHEKRKFSRRNWFAWKLEVFWQIATALRLKSKSFTFKNLTLLVTFFYSEFFRHLNEKNLTHGNLRASNILLFTDGPTTAPQPIVKLADPGVTKAMVADRGVQLQLPIPWRPVDFVEETGTTPEWSPSVDTWSFATTVKASNF